MKNDEGNRDRSVERLLRQTLHAPAASEPPGPCLDPETLAAWADAALPAGERAAAEAHVADCARCQATLGTLARIAPAVQAPERWWRARTLGWLVPLTAAATAAAIWVAVPRDDRRPRSELVAQPAQGRDMGPQTPASQATPGVGTYAAKPETSAALAGRAPAPELGGRLQARRDPSQDEKKTEPAKMAQTEERGIARESSALAKERDAARNVAAAAAAVAPGAPASAAAPPPPAAAAKALRAVATPAIGIVSPDSASRWRTGAAGFVERSTDGGATWQTQPTGVAAEITAGASPSASVCWLVGRGGTVLLSTDGLTWRHLVFPESVDLVAVRATDAKMATATLADGRTLTTRDGGLTWDPAPLQESSAAPF